MLRQYLAESTGNFWWSEELKKSTNPDFENPKHLQKPGNLLLTAPSIGGNVLK